MKGFSCRVFGCVLTFAILFGGLFAASGEAATVFDNDGGAGDLVAENGSNWDSGLPGTGAAAGTVPTGFALTTAGNDVLDNMDITFTGNSSLATAAGLKLNGGIFTFQDTSLLNSTGTLAVGRDFGAGAATLNVSDNAVLTTTIVGTGGDFKLGFKDDGVLNMSGGTLNIAVDLDLGGNGGGGGENIGVGTFNFSGGIANFGGKGNWDPGSNGSVLNFTAGSTGIMTFGNSGADYTTDLEAAINAFDIVVDGSNAAVSAFDINFAGGITSIQLAGAPAPQTLQLLVNTTTGEVSLHNPTGAAVALDYYEIRSAAGDLIVGLDADFEPDGDVDSADLAIWQGAFGVNGNADADNDGDSDGTDFLSWQRGFGASAANSGWESLEDQDFEGNGDSSSGNGWQEGATVSSELLFETYLTGDSEIADGATISLGNLLAVGGAETLTFEYHVATDGEVFTAGDVTYAAALAAVTAVPEPTTLTLLVIGLAGLAGRRRA